MRAFSMCPACSAEMPRSTRLVLRAAFVVLLAVVSLSGGSAEALQRSYRQLDTANDFRNAGIYMFTNAPNDLGRPVGAVVAYCSGVLIHERVFMTAAHCAGWHVNGVLPFLRMVVSFSHDNPRDPSTWIDTTGHLVHPTFPWQECVVPPNCPAGGVIPPGVPISDWSCSRVQ